MDALDSVVRLFGYPLAVIGLFSFLVWIYQTFVSLVEIGWGLWKQWMVGADLVRRYGRWAVITGGSDGIGRQYSLFLASKGFNIVILAMSDEKLDKTTQEIQQKFKVHVKPVPIDFSKGFELTDLIKKELGNLDIGVLINNVGTVSCKKSAYFDAFPLEHHRLLINVNICAAVMMTYLVLPGMKQRSRGLIVNVASVFGLTPIPRMLMYGATKAFVYSFSEALRHEVRPFGVECQTVTPALVSTTMVKDFKAASWFARLISVSSDNYGRFLTMTLGKTVRTTGHWIHAVQVTLMKLVPTDFMAFYYGKTV